MNRLRERISSDKGAGLSVEMIMLIALAIFGILVIFSQIMEPMRESATSIGGKIKEMGE